MINFNVPLVYGNELENIKTVIDNRKTCGDGEFTKKCSKLFEEKFSAKKVLMTTSCTHALELAAILADIKEGDEVIMPSFTFVSTSNAFALRGAKIVFVDVDDKTMNVSAKEIEKAVTEKTKVIVPVHYAGVSCDMDEIMEIANKHNLLVIEDAAQGVMSKYKGKYLGTIGHIGCYSFHETKNYNMGEGGAIVINDERFIERAEIVREKGTDRSKFFRGNVDKYTWQDIGSSYLPSELNVAFLYSQMLVAEEINDKRVALWNRYYENLEELEKLGKLERPYVGEDKEHNGHMFYIKVKDYDERNELMDYLRENGVHSVFHYIPLHSSPYGEKNCVFRGEDVYTTKNSERLVRLPMYYELTLEEVDKITDCLQSFFM